MPRARLLKPGFFTNPKLSELSPLTRLLFAGLWTLSDRMGRMRDESRWIKGSLFPYENANVEKMLADLARLGFITRYESEGERFLEVTNFLKHQSPHIKEAASTIPAPDKHSASTGNSGTSPAVPIPIPIPIPIAVTPDPVSVLCSSFAKWGKVTAGTVQSIEEDVSDFGLDLVQQAERVSRAGGYDGEPAWGYVHSTLERLKKEEDQRNDNGAKPGRNGANAGAHTNGVASGVSDLERRRAAIAEQRRSRST